MDSRPRKKGRDLVLQDDGSYRFRYHGTTYSMRVRRHLDTDTWDVVSVWSVAAQQHISVPPCPIRDRWEALLAGELNRSRQEARRAAERVIDGWLRRQEEARRSAG